MPQWTKDQQSVIDCRDKNMLVSAAAGSGKTAVLVERIIERVLDEKNPVGIDRIVVVTFTRAAASEMKERVLEAINKKLATDPNNLYLIRQSTLVHNALITTIDSFCSYIVRNHFHEIGIEPDFRVADEGELKLLRKEVLDDLLEDQYALLDSKEENKAFFDFVDAYGTTKNDDAIRDIIYKLYEKSVSFPWPNEWLESLKKPYAINCEEDLFEMDWFVESLSMIYKRLDEGRLLLEKQLEICKDLGGAKGHITTLESDISSIKEVLSYSDLRPFFNAFCELEFMRLSTTGTRGKDACQDEKLMSDTKAVRGAVVDEINNLKKIYGLYSTYDIVSQMKNLSPYVDELIHLTNLFSQNYASSKREKNIVDFSDIEHFALEILVNRETKKTTATARLYQEFFQEIMIDEYQDSNYIQEEILTAISGEELGKHNMFMVGDVKQSIYSFRQACPDIFIEKLHRFLEKDESSTAIVLQQNFRSRPQVLDCANDIFDALMHEDIGGVEYDDAAALRPGATFEMAEDPGAYDAEILLVAKNKDFSSVEMEAKVVANRITSLMKEAYVTDKETKKLRKITYKDIAILMRSPSGMAEDFVRVLQENGIPAFAENKTGYFSATEVCNLLNLLRIIDNPRQDIAFTAVLHSDIFGFSDEEIAKIRLAGPDLSLYEAMKLYAFDEEGGVKDEKAAGFLTYLDEKRNQVADIPIHIFIEDILVETGYLTYVSAMPRGESRRANLEKLIDEAVCYESTSYKGLFNFVNYMQLQEKYEVNVGQAQVVSENDDAVTIMSIHHSKGLEYPLVFVSGLGKEFNMSDMKGNIILSGNQGLGMRYIDYNQQTSTEGFYRNYVKNCMMADSYGEEMRVLYVALTRAKEKLIMTASVPDNFDEWDDGKTPSYSQRMGSKMTFIQWIIRASTVDRDKYPIRIFRPEDLIEEEVIDQVDRVDKRAMLQDASSQAKENWVTYLEEQISYVYPSKSFGQFKNKYSVSEIKHQQMERIFSDDMTSKPEFLKEEIKEPIPAFIAEKEKRENVGALRGSAMHRFLECYDFSVDDLAADLEGQKESMISSGKLKVKEADLLQMKKIADFMEDTTAKRMQKAAKADSLFVEKPFVMLANPKELFLTEEEGAEDVLVQGIIDVFFIEDGQIVLLDYKTDRVKTDDELIKRYDAQLQLYAKALSKTLGLPVKEILIYSFCLEKTIAL